MAVYQFDVEHACRWGVNEAIFLQNLIYWLRKNKAEGRNVRSGEDGVPRVWTFSKTEALAQLYPFWKTHQVRYVIDSLRKQGVLVTGQFADQPFDRTLWFALADESLLELPDLPGSPGEEAARGRANPFEKFRKSRREDTQMEATNSADGGAKIRTSLKEKINSNRLTTTDTAAADDGRTAEGTSLSEASAAAVPPTSDKPSSTDAVTTAEGGVATLPPEPDLVEKLLATGLNRADARRLAAADPAECRRQLEFLPFVTEFKASRGAYLRAAIEQGFAPPREWEKAQERTQAVTKRRAADLSAGAGFQHRRARETARQEALAAERARIEREEPARWAEIVAQAEDLLPPPLRGKTGHVAYGPALQGNIDRLVQEGLPERVREAATA